MRINSYKYRDFGKIGWDFTEIPLHSINLLVGASGSGKTRFLNTIFNLGTFIRSGKISVGEWQLDFSTNDIRYKYNVKIDQASGDKKPIILEELLIRVGTDDDDHEIISRTTDAFLFNGAKLPKLDRRKSGITLLQDEEELDKIFSGFGYILRRNFASLSSAAPPADETFNFKPEQIKDLESNPNNSNSIQSANFPISASLFSLQKRDVNKYEIVVETFKGIFSSIEAVRLVDAVPDKSGYTPIFEIKERDVNNWIPVFDLSSGMNKVLLILTDIMLLPKGSIYLIDEYENSLGVNAINFLPSFLVSYASDKQFIITTHHPYLINNMDIKNWYLFHRAGSKVSVSYGDELVKKYGHSKHENFTKLINDPLYSGET